MGAGPRAARGVRATGPRDDSRAEALIAVTTGVIVTALLLLLGIAVAPQSVSLSRALEPSSFRFALVIVVCRWLLDFSSPDTGPSRFRGPSLPSSSSQRPPCCSRYRSCRGHRGSRSIRVRSPSSRRTSTPSGCSGSACPPAELRIPGGQPATERRGPADTQAAGGDHPRARSDRDRNQFFGVYPGTPGDPGFDDQVLARISLYERFGVQYIVTPASSTIFSATPSVTLVYKGPQVAIYGLSNPTPLASAAGCTVTTVHQDQYMTECHASILLRDKAGHAGLDCNRERCGGPGRLEGSPPDGPGAEGSRCVSLSRSCRPARRWRSLPAILGVLAFLVPSGSLLAIRRRRRPGALRGTVHDTAPTSVVYLDLPEPLDHPTVSSCLGGIRAARARPRRSPSWLRPRQDGHGTTTHRRSPSHGCHRHSGRRGRRLTAIPLQKGGPPRRW